MAKLKDFLQKVFEQGDVRGDDVAAVLGASSLAELELPDTAIAKFNEAYLTRSRAENDPEIVKKIKLSSKAEILDTVDLELTKLLPLVDSVKSAEIAKNPNTFKKLELLTEAIGETVKNGMKTKDKDVQKVEEEWSAKTKALEKIYNEKIETIKKQNEESNLNFALKSKLLTFEYAEAFASLKGPLTETIISKIKASKTKAGEPIVLELDQSGDVNVRHLVEGTLRDVYRDGNEKLTIDNLIAPEVEPFIKKSNGKADEKETGGVKTKTKDIDFKNATLTEIRQFNSAQ